MSDKYCAIATLTGDACELVFPHMVHCSKIEVTTKIMDTEHGDLIFAASLQPWIETFSDSKVIIENTKSDSVDYNSNLQLLYTLTSDVGIMCEIFNLHDQGEEFYGEFEGENFANLN